MKEDISGWFQSKEGGSYLQKFEKTFAEYCKAKHAIAVSSGSAAIYIALKACGIGRLDFVAVPTYTHIGSIAPIVLADANPVFIDVDKYGNISIESLERALTIRNGDVDAVICVHQLGIPCEMDQIKSLCGKPTVIIEDASHALGSTYKGNLAGTLGDIGCFSIGGGRTKTIGTGEGGMIVTNNDELAEKCKNLRNHGDRTFDADYLCFNFRMSEINALIGYLQMQKLNELIEWQIFNAEYIIHSLPGFLEVPEPPAYASTVRYIIGCHFNSQIAEMTRDEFLQKVKAFQIAPRRYIGSGYSKLISDVKFYSHFRYCTPELSYPMAEKLRDESVWIDYHRYPIMKNEIDEMIEVLHKI